MFMPDFRRSPKRHLLATAAAAIASVAIALGATAAVAQPRGATTVDLSNAAASEAVRAYWTPERLANAVPMMPRASGAPSAGAAPVASGPSVTSPGGMPTVARTAALEEVFMPGATPAAEAADAVAPTATDGSYGLFTTSRVFPDAAVSAWPNITVGKLFFRDPRRGADYVCSASVLRQRVVATAGHCVANPSTTASGRYFFTNFVFIPALTNGTGPLGAWTPASVTVANVFYFGNGTYPNAGDWGFLRMNDRVINGATRRIGDLTGFLGYATNSLPSNHVSALGYPCNLDSCNRMQVTHAQIRGFWSPNSYYIGSAMRGGSSGGPWIQDYGIRAAGTAPSQITQLGRNFLVGVTSYGPTSTSFAFIGASNFNNDWLSILNTVCGSATTRNCTN